MRLTVITVNPHCHNSEDGELTVITVTFTVITVSNSELTVIAVKVTVIISTVKVTVITVRLTVITVKLTVITVNSYCYNSQSICQIVWEAHPVLQATKPTVDLEHAEHKIDAHNDEIMKSISSNNPPENTLSPFTQCLFVCSFSV